MARKPTSEVLERRRGATVVYAIRFRAYGKRRYVTLGTKAEAWSRPGPRKGYRTCSPTLAAAFGAGRCRRPPLRTSRPSTCSPPIGSRRCSTRVWRNTLLDHEWQLTKHLLPYFAQHGLSEIAIAEVDRYRQLKVREGVINAISINKSIQRLAQILDVAVEAS